MPRRLFARVEDVASYGWALAILLTAVTLVGYATVETGLIDQAVDRSVGGAIAQIDSMQRDVVERSELRELYAQERKKGEFTKLLARLQVIGAEPAKMLASVLLIGALFYGAVALTGRKPEWHTLMTICVLASFVDLLRLVVRLALMLQYSSLEVDTSLASLAALLLEPDGSNLTSVAALSGLATGLDVFRIWFWLVVIAGLSTTAQLPGWRAWTLCTLCWLIAAGVRCGMTVAAVSQVERAAAAAQAS